MSSLEDPNVNGYSYEDLEEITKFVQNKSSCSPIVGIVCGSGLGSLSNLLENAVTIPYEQIPKFPVSTVQGHGGCMVLGKLSSVPVVCFSGRFHYYEGYPLWKCCIPIRIIKLLGCSHFITTNAAGGINQEYKLGNIMILKDHVNFVGFSGNNPLRGPNEEKFGIRFPGMNTAYDKTLRQEALEIAKNMGIEDKVFEGVYACVGGPNYETVAELRLMQTCGIDAVGMSTAHEVVVAKHCGLTVFGFSLISNECILTADSDKIPNHEEVLEATKNMEETLQEFVKRIVEYIGISTCSCKKQ